MQFLLINLMETYQIKREEERRGQLGHGDWVSSFKLHEQRAEPQQRV